MTTAETARVPNVSLPWLGAAKVVAGSGIGMLTNFGPIVIYTFGTFLLPISQDTGWSRASVAAALAPAAILSGLLQPVIGRIVDRYGPRVFAAWSFGLFSLGLIALGQLPRDPITFAVCMGLLGVLGAGQGITAFTYIVSRSFTARRGLALGIINACSAAGIMTMPALATIAIANYGWRASYTVIGLGVALIGAVAVIWLIPDRENFGRTTEDQLPWAKIARDLLRQPIFWVLAIAFLLMTLVIQGLVVHMTPLLMDRGFKPAEAAGVMAVYGLSMLVCRFGLGLLLDHWSPRLVAVVGCLGPIAASLLLLTGQSGPTVFIAAGLLAVGAGAESDLIPYSVARQFGLANLGQKIGIFIVVFALGVTIGPLLFSTVQSAYGSYNYALLLSSGIMTGAAIIFALAHSAALAQRGEPSIAPNLP